MMEICFFSAIDTGCDCGRDEVCIDRICVPDPPPPTCETTVCDEYMVCMYDGMNPVCVCDQGYKPEGGRCVPGMILETVGKMKRNINCPFLQLIKRGNCKQQNERICNGTHSYKMLPFSQFYI